MSAQRKAAPKIAAAKTTAYVMKDSVSAKTVLQGQAVHTRHVQILALTMASALRANANVNLGSKELTAPSLRAPMTALDVDFAPALLITSAPARKALQEVIAR